MTGPKAPTFPASLEGLQSTRPQAAQQTQQAAASNGGYSIDAGNREQVRLFYNSVFASSAGIASGWSGNVAGCNAGDTSADYKAAILRRINWFRALAGVPASVQFDASFSQQAQQAALMMAANQQLSHSPPSSWLCYSSAGAQAAGKSNLTIGRSGPDAIGESYMRDEGANNTGVGHRRWLLYPQTQFMGTGDVDGSSPVNALWVQDSNIFGPRPAVRDDFVAWPTKGYTPYALVYPRWSFSYPGADFSSASVAMTENGAAIATRVETPATGYGENTLAWFPGSYVDGMSWAKPDADTIYQVTISNVKVAGIARTFSYSATVFDPQTSAVPALTLSGPASLAAGQAGSYAFDAVSGATGYQWRTLAVSSQSFADGAEAGAGNFSASTSTGYPVVATDVSASGVASFHLAHVQPVDQILLLNETLMATATSVLRFDSRLGIASTGQVALVEASVDDGATWSTLYQQAGQLSGTTSSLGETSFTPKTISLAAFANRALRLRWRYQLVGGISYYPQSSTGAGWYIDNIEVTGILAVTAAGAPTDIAGTGFQAGFGTGTIVLQARAGMYGYFGEWGYAKEVDVSATLPQADCLFDWAQGHYASLFGPPASSQVLDVYYYRHYTGTSAYLGISSANDHVYYLPEGGSLLDAGPKSGWFATAGCP
ncbi:MAG: CAP domain-containing protein [Ramlibacter sp.]